MGTVIWRARTACFGFTALAFFQIASASLSAFLVGRLFGLDESWVTEERLFVFAYSSVGLAGYALGAHLAWRPLRQRVGVVSPESAEVRSGRAFLYVALGAVAYLAFPFILGLPTARAVSTNFMGLL